MFTLKHQMVLERKNKAGSWCECGCTPTVRTHEHLYAQKENGGFLGTALPLMMFVRILSLSGFVILCCAQALAS